jgi:hypothetical protein
MVDIYYKRNRDRFYKVVEDKDNSAVFYIEATETEFKGIGITNEDLFGYDNITEGEWMDLLDSYNDALVYALEFVGGHPPHFPIPTRPK